MDVVCYACGKDELPENTLEAIAHCQKINPDWHIEMDLQLTKDGQVVLFHDDNLSRITKIEKNIFDVNYAEIKNFDAAYNFKKNLEYPLRGKSLRIPLLEEVFKKFPKAKYVLDVHSNNLEIVEKVIYLIEQNYVGKQLVLVSKYHHIIALFRARRPYWKYGASAKEVKWILLNNFVGLGGLLKLKAEVIMMPIIYKEYRLLSKGLVKQVAKKHKKIWVWLHEGKQVVTIDSINQFERVKKYNVDAFFTSCPEQLYKEMSTII